MDFKSSERLVISFLFFIITFSSLSQDKNTLRDSISTPIDSTVVEKDTTVGFNFEEVFLFTDYSWGAYLGMTSGASPNPGGAEDVISFLGGLQYRFFIIEFGLYSYQGNYSKRLIFPNEFQINYLYGSGAIGFRFINKRWIELSSVLTVGNGDMLWERSTNFENLFSDKFWIVKPEIRLEVTPTKFTRVFTGIGYQSMQGLELSQLQNSDFSGAFIQIGLKLGYYQKQKSK
jgi:hypothetical protein